MDTSSRSSRSSSPTDEKHILEAWQPEPLIPSLSDEVLENYKHVLNPHIITSKPGKYITVDGFKCLNLSTNNYLGIADDERLVRASIEATNKYGVGSCGPRAFYGTMDVHLKLEEELAKFLQVQETVLYSFGFSTIASAIPAYAKQSDVVFMDECCNFAIQQGLKVARSKLILFRHNDIGHLRELVAEFHDEQMKKYGKSNHIRTFLLVEGIYSKTGQICPLRELIEIKNEYKIRLFIDESRSFGVLGSEGKGVTEHFNIDINDVDLIMATLDNALCAFGGFCAGSTYIIDHQRLAGTGYCFSASLPPLQTQVALEALDIIRNSPKIVQNCQELYVYAHESLKKLTKLYNISHPLSPIKLLIIKPKHDPDQIADNLTSLSRQEYCRNGKRLSMLCERILAEERIAVSVSRYNEDDEMTHPLASIRLVIGGCLDIGQVDDVVDALERHSVTLDQ